MQGRGMRCGVWNLGSEVWDLGILGFGFEAWGTLLPEVHHHCRHVLHLARAKRDILPFRQPFRSRRSGLRVQGLGH